MGNFRAVRWVQGTGGYQEHQFIHLVRLAWDLRGLGLEVSIELSQRQEPCLTVRRASGPLLRIVATKRAQEWVFAWGRGRDQWGAALDSEVPHHIREMAR